MLSQGEASLLHELEELRRQNADLRSEVAYLRGTSGAAPARPDRIQSPPSRREASILESATGYAIFSMDADGLITSWSEGARLIHGWTENEAVGRHTRLIFTPEDQKAGTAEEEMRVAASRGSAENERWHVRKDGSRFYAAGLLMPLRDGSGGFVKILRDRTEQLHAERNKLRHLERMKALAQAARVVMGAVDLSTTLEAITVAARDIIGAHQAICSITRGPDWSQAVTAVSLSDKYAAWRAYDKVPDGSGVYAWICEGNRTVRMTQAELEEHPRWRAFGEHSADHPPMNGWLATALVGSDGKNLGLIQLSDKIEREFDEVDEAILVQLGQFAASAIERAQAGDELRRSEERLREAFAISTVGVLFWGPEFKLTEANDAFLRMTGFSHEEALGKTWQDLTPKEFYPESLRAVEQVTTLGEAIPYEKQYFRKDGSRWWGLFAPRKVGDEVVEFVLDVSDRKRTEDELRESEARFRAAVDAVQGVLWTNNAHGEMVGEQPGWAALTGQTRDEYQGFGWAKAVHPDDAEASVAAWNEAVRAR
ncbi:MAG: PAS domain S-box protein, partial [Pseudomonadota bacterium]|nr:PAS domain S-box protein [Pseudomonadota bacterium]